MDKVPDIDKIYFINANKWKRNKMRLLNMTDSIWSPMVRDNETQMSHVYIYKICII